MPIAALYPNVSSYAFEADNANATRTIGGWAADQANLLNYGGDPTGTVDSGAALTKAINYIMGLTLSQRPILYIPGGTYLINTLPPLITSPVFIKGDGPHKTVFLISSVCPSGDLFAWSNCWQQNWVLTGSTILPSQDSSAPGIADISIVGNLTYANQVNGIVFYDRNDSVLVRNIEIDYLNGRALWIGMPNKTASAYMRESFFENFKTHSCGTSGTPAVEISSDDPTSGDASNELDFYKLRIFRSAGSGLAIRNPNNYNATRSMRFFSTIVENSLAGDNICIGGTGLGSSTDVGTIDGLEFYSVESLTCSAGFNSFTVTTGPGGTAPYNINVYGLSIPNGSGNGLVINSGRSLLFDISMINTSQTNIMIGSGAGKSILIRNQGNASSWTNSLSGNGFNLASNYSLYGNPSNLSNAGSYILVGSGIASSGAIRLTSDGNAPNSYNTFNIPNTDNLLCNVSVVAFDSTTPTNAFSYNLPQLFVATRSAAFRLYTSGTPVSGGIGTGVSASISISADTSNEGLNITFTPPSSSDTWQITARIDFVLV